MEAIGRSVPASGAGSPPGVPAVRTPWVPKEMFPRQRGDVPRQTGDVPHKTGDVPHKTGDVPHKRAMFLKPILGHLLSGPSLLPPASQRDGSGIRGHGRSDGPHHRAMVKTTTPSAHECNLHGVGRGWASHSAAFVGRGRVPSSRTRFAYRGETRLQSSGVPATPPHRFDHIGLLRHAIEFMRVGAGRRWQPLLVDPVDLVRGPLGLRKGDYDFSALSKAFSNMTASSHVCA